MKKILFICSGNTCRSPMAQGIFNKLSKEKNLDYIAEFGRYDDLLMLFDTPVEKDMLELIRKQLHNDICAASNNEEVSLLGKWLPSVNTSNRDAVKMAKKI